MSKYANHPWLKVSVSVLCWIEILNAVFGGTSLKITYVISLQSPADYGELRDIDKSMVRYPVFLLAEGGRGLGMTHVKTSQKSKWKWLALTEWLLNEPVINKIYQFAFLSQITAMSFQSFFFPNSWRWLSDGEVHSPINHWCTYFAWGLFPLNLKEDIISLLLWKYTQECLLLSTENK